jgi:hypothetical protein
MRLRATAWAILALCAAGALLASLFSPLRAASTSAPPLPGDTRLWIGPPQSWDALRGRVVLLDVWTFG